MQAIADEEAIDSVEQATSSRVEMISQAMKNYLIKSREKRSYTCSITPQNFFEFFLKKKFSMKKFTNMKLDDDISQ